MNELWRMSIKGRWQMVAAVLSGLLVCLWGLAACGPSRQPRAKLRTAPEIQSVALAPCIDMAGVYGVNSSLRSPITGKVFVTGAVADGTATLFDSLILQQISNAGTMRIISPRVVRGELGLLMAGKDIGMPERRKVLALGRRTGADAVMAGYIYRYEERRGTSYAAEKPASVSFGLHLLRVADGRVLWSGYFTETQQALTENLFEFDSFVKRGAKWVTARDMATDAVGEMLSGTVEETP